MDTDNILYYAKLYASYTALVLGVIGILVGAIMIYGWDENKNKTHDGSFNDYALGATVGFIAGAILMTVGVYGAWTVPDGRDEDTS